MVGMTIIAIWAESALDDTCNDTANALRRGALTSEIERGIDGVERELMLMMMMREKDKKEEHRDLLQAAREGYRRHVEEIKVLKPSTRALALLSSVDDALTEARDTNQKVVKLALGGQDAEASALFLSMSLGKKERIVKMIEELKSVALVEAKESDDRAEAFLVSARRILIAVGLLAVGLASFFGISVTRSIAGPMSATAKSLSEVAEGDLTHQISQELVDRKDEAGDLARATQRLVKGLRDMIGEVGASATTLTNASGEMSAISQALSKGSKDVAGLATTVAAAAEESSANTTSVAAAMEQTTTNLTSVASATEEMSATIGEIAANAEKARAISSEATEQAQTISTMMKELGRAAQEIGKVTETITSISAQTNLLALNATIEAARAGAAGKGFAVVANEIKELAQQTASATEDIKSKISGIQASTGGAMGDIEKIAQVIKEVGDIVSSIAAAIEEQSSVTKDVAGNISQATLGVKDANERVSQTAAVSQSIAKDIAMVNATVTDLVTGGEQVQAGSEELSHVASQLKQRVTHFRV
jgi:methyl-accepting chemotaxis protein